MDEATTALPTDEIGQALQTEFKQNGMSGVYGLAEQFLNKWKRTCLNLAITGRSGTGKSSFINAVRQVGPNHPSAAQVGVTQTTKKIEPYPHPESANLLLWDKPGVGTPTFPRDTYLENIKFERFDFYVILSSDRFMEIDLWLASEIKKAGKKYFFVRTKIDESVNNEKHDHPGTFKEEDVLCRIRQDCVESLRQENMEGMPIFLLSSREPTKWDFRKTMIQLINDCPEIKKDVAVLAFSATSKEIIEKKKAVLQKDIKLYAILSGCTGAMPVMFLNFAVDAALILRVSQIFAKQFGLDKSSITKIAATYDVPVSILQPAMQVSVFATVGEVTKWLLNLQFDKVPSTLVEFVPIVGSIVGGIASFAFTDHILNKLLNDYEKCAVTMLNKIEEHLKEKDMQM